jgi:hypothetical protein
MLCFTNGCDTYHVFTPNLQPASLILRFCGDYVKLGPVNDRKVIALIDRSYCEEQEIAN